MTLIHVQKIDEDHFKKLWSLDLSTQDIAERLGRSQSSVCRAARRLGLPPKTSQGRRWQ